MGVLFGTSKEVGFCAVPTAHLADLKSLTVRANNMAPAWSDMSASGSESAASLSSDSDSESDTSESMFEDDRESEDGTGSGDRWLVREHPRSLWGPQHVPWRPLPKLTPPSLLCWDTHNKNFISLLSQRRKDALHFRPFCDKVKAKPRVQHLQSLAHARRRERNHVRGYRYRRR